MFQLFQTSHLLYANDNFLVLAAKALYLNKQYATCEGIISKQVEVGGELQTNPRLRSAKLLILAKCQEALEKKKSAVANLVESLKSDPSNSEALGLLMESFLVTVPESSRC